MVVQCIVKLTVHVIFGLLAASAASEQRYFLFVNLYESARKFINATVCETGVFYTENLLLERLRVIMRADLFKKIFQRASIP